MYEKAIEVAQEEDYKASIPLLLKAVNIDKRFADAYLSLGGIYGQIKNYDSSIINYEKAKDIDSLYFQEYNLPYSINLAGKGEFEKALKAVNSFLMVEDLNEKSIKAGEYRKKCFSFAVEYAQKQGTSGYKFEPHNLGDSINTSVSEYYPTITLDGNTLVFTRRVNHFNEDFFESTMKDNHWGKATVLLGNINTNQNEGAQNISQDGQWLIFTGCNFPDGLGSCDLYISYLTKEGWSTPENLGSRVNTEFLETAPSLSPDKRDLYFASRRPDGYGGSDIYVCHRTSSGRWGNPENLGPTINTAGDEGAPFIHADNQTLYFTSNGHPGYGGDDLFLSRKCSPDGKWGTPENLGYPINTIENEGMLVIAADGVTAYYSSDRSDSRGGLDLYTFELRKDIRPLRTLWVKGRVFDAKTLKGLPSAVELTELESQETISKLQTDETGNYLITLPVGKDYAFSVNRRGYLFYSDNFSLREQADSTYNIDIALQPIEANATIVLKNIFFDLNEYKLKDESEVELDKVVQLLKENPTLKIQISGHTDNIGKAKDNLVLSENRAKEVIKYLVDKGIQSSRLSYKGFGSTMPIADNSTEAGRAKNRRTELKVISQ